jgi:hypothetical protein
MSNITRNWHQRVRNELPQAANRVVGGVGCTRHAADRIVGVGTEQLALRFLHDPYAQR